MKKSLIILFLILVAHTDAFGQWVQTNGPYGGWVNCISANGTNLFAGTVDGGFHSTNNGANWTPMGDGSGLPYDSVYDHYEYIQSLAVVGTKFLGGTYRHGIYLSPDSGVTWNAAGVSNTGINSFRVVGTRVFAGTGSGVFLSTDTGITWKEADTGLSGPSSYINTFAVMDSIIFAGTNGGVYHTTDFGATWIAVNAGLTKTSVFSLITIGTNLFAGTESGLFISIDSGKNWQVDSSMSTPFTALALMGGNLFAGATGYGVFLSSDSGTNWNFPTNTGLTKNFDYAYFEALTVSDTNLFAGTSDGVFISTNSGASWSSANNGITNSNINTFVVSDTSLFAATTAGGLFLTIDNGISWSATSESFTDRHIFDFAVSGQNIFVGTRDSGVFHSTDNGADWTAAINGLSNTDIYALATNDTFLFAGSFGGGVFRSTDTGASWTATNSGMTNHTNIDVYALAVIGTNLFAGASSIAGAFVSTDNGTNWQSTADLPDPAAATAFAVMGTNLFAVANGQGIFVSTDSGMSWQPTALTFPNYVPDIQDLAVSGSNLFAATDGNGIVQSSDSGKSWNYPNTGLSDLNITSIAVIGENLFAGTTTCGVWRRPLSEMIPTPSAVETQAPIQTSLTAYPNPLSQSTTIRFTSAESGVARVWVVNLLGEEVARVFEGALTAGEHSWVWSKPTGLPSGMYECIVEMNGSTQQVPVVVTQ